MSLMSFPWRPPSTGLSASKRSHLDVAFTSVSKTAGARHPVSEFHQTLAIQPEMLVIAADQQRASHGRVWGRGLEGGLCVQILTLPNFFHFLVMTIAKIKQSLLVGTNSYNILLRGLHLKNTCQPCVCVCASACVRVYMFSSLHLECTRNSDSCHPQKEEAVQ
jgi:hypothetical protein